ncbi:AMP-binding protein [Flavobacterium sp. TSSA_36]|uniref:AMP-binding protein n=1 Tax=Flavobacterium sp. TSSA_36 TaxID=3447669 RepID=UPI003F34CCAD
MKTVTYKNVHNHFKFNGVHLNREQLCMVAYSFIKEGADFQKALGDFLIDWFDNKSYIEMNTSGSTGIPKLIRVEKQAMVSSALATGDFFDLQPGNKVLHCLPVDYVAGKMMFVRSFILGLDMDFVAPNSNPLQYIDSKYDFTAMVPLQAKNSLDKLKNIKKIIIGGVKIHKSLEEKLVKLPNKIYETYGMTETITHIAAKRVGEKAFKTLPNVTVSVDENSGLVVHAPAINSNPIVTNDIVDLISDTEFVWLGRLDNIINSGGVKLMPEKIEEKLSTHIPRRFFIAGQSDAVLGEKVILYVEGDPMTIDASIFERLDKFEKPKEIVFVPVFEVTATGKIIRKEPIVA